MAASSYAYTAMEQQQSQAEFQAIQKSFITYDDAVRDVSWNKGSYHLARFTCQYGFLEAIPDEIISIAVAECPNATYTGTTSYLRYNLSSSYLTYGDGYENYILGNQSSIVTSSTEDLSQLVINQESNWVSASLSYRIRVLKEPPVSNYNYVDIMITRLDVQDWSTRTGIVDLSAKNTAISSVSYGPYNLTSCTINVNSSGMPHSQPEQLSLTFGEQSIPVVFNFIISNVRVTV